MREMKYFCDICGTETDVSGLREVKINGLLKFEEACSNCTLAIKDFVVKTLGAKNLNSHKKETIV